MNKKVTTGIVLIFCITALSLPVGVSAGDATEDAANIGFQMLEEPVNPRFIAMGFTGGALAGKGFSFYNPALPFLVGQSYLSAEYGMYPKADLKHTQLETVLSLENWFVGLSLHSESIDDIYETNVWGNPPYYDVPFSAQFTDISLAVGFTQWEDFALALSVNGLQDRIHDESAYALTFSAGAVVVPVPERLSLGLSLLNVGFSTPMLGADSGSVWGEGEKLPLNARFGAAWTDSFKDMPYTVALDVVYRNVRDRSDPFTRHIRDRFTVPLGFELWPLPPLAVRMGKRINFPTEIINFGIGFKLEQLTVDASFVIPRLVDDAELKWLTGITWYLSADHKKRRGKKKAVDKPSTVTQRKPVSDTAKPAQDTLGQVGGQTPKQAVDTTKIKPATVHGEGIPTTNTPQPVQEKDTSSVPDESVIPPRTLQSGENPAIKDSEIPGAEQTPADPIKKPDEPIQKTSPPAEAPEAPSSTPFDTIPQ